MDDAELSLSLSQTMNISFIWTPTGEDQKGLKMLDMLAIIFPSCQLHPLYLPVLGSLFGGHLLTLLGWTEF